MGTAECRLCGKTIEGNVPDYQAGRSFLGTGSDVHFRSDEITWKLAHDLMEHHSRCEKRTKENNAVDFDVYLGNRSTLVGLFEVHSYAVKLYYFFNCIPQRRK